MINVGVFGYGTVGSGVVEVLTENASLIERKVGDKVNVKWILDLRDFPGDKHEKKITHDVKDILNDPEVKVICETMGGTGAAFEFTKEALKKGISVCTSNKELVASHGPELLSLAKENNCSYKFEASVGGGIPIIRPLQDCITADEVEAVIGIVNGTTNYMLTKMTNEAAEFDAVLKEAQKNGFAEANPDADIKGFDACRKIAILSSLVYGKTVNYEDIHTEGITNISARDIKYAKALGLKVKLLAKYEKLETGAYALVAPHLVPTTNPLYHVNEVFNGILVRGNMLGDAMFYGRGAGKLPTASAVCSDVVELAKNVGKNIPCDWVDEPVKLDGLKASKKAFFIRVGAELKKEAKENFKVVKEVHLNFYDEYAFVTDVMTEEEFEAATAKVGKLINYIRIEK